MVSLVDLRKRLTTLMRDRHGPLTRELVRSPGGFGLGQVPTRLEPDATTSMVCGFCSTGCGLDLHLRQGQAVNLSPTTEYPVNLGMACPKGWQALAPLDAPDRATTPMLRDGGGRLRPVDWQAALTLFVDRMKAIQARHGPESVAFLSTGQVPSEEMALLGALAKFGMGMKHGDGNTRQCMATAVVAYKQAFGFDAPPYTYADFEESDVLFFVGANPCIAHPIMWERVCRNPHGPRIVVLDPRRTETAQAATDHVALAPKSDLSLLYAITHVLIREGWIDREFVEAHTTGFDALSRHVREFTPERAARDSRVDASEIERLARIVHEGERVSFWWTMGVNQSHQGVRTAQAMINIALLTGNIGRPGTGANSITGQCNAMGSRLFSNTTNLLGGHAFDDPGHRAKVASILEIDEARIPHTPSWAYDQIMEGVLDGKIRGLWVIATNTAHSWINQDDARQILDRLDFLVVQDMYHSTETAAHADLVLPAAGWGEKEGTFINSERRIGLIKPVRRAPGQALSDFRIFKLIAEAWGCGGMFRKWSSPEATFQLLKRCTEDMPCDITGIEDYGMIDEMGGIQWPLPAGAQPQRSQQRRLFADGRFYTPDGRARLLFDAHRPLPEPPSERYPLTLLTGRGSSAQWHTQTRTGKSAVLRKLGPSAPYVELSPGDATSLGVRPEDLVLVSSRRATVRVRAFVSHVVPRGQVFMPMHFALTNRLTLGSFDPHSRQPAYKACAVRVERINLHTPDVD
ncbi:MAG: nitrate reductase [Myxococcales bacterium]|jgi:assimilatory nitrate reductase catalytic subunit